MHSGDLAVLFDASLEFHQYGMAAAVAIKNFFACQTNFDGPVEHQSGLCNYDFMIEGVALSPETAAVRRGDHATMRGRHFQDLSERAMHVMRRLRAGPDGQLSFRILDGHGSVLLNGKMSVSLEEECVFEDFICFGKTFFHIAEL